MSARFRRMAARLWPDSLFRRLAVILLAGLLIILGLGLYQRLSADVEEQVEARDKAAEEKPAKKKS